MKMNSLIEESVTFLKGDCEIIYRCTCVGFFGAKYIDNHWLRSHNTAIHRITFAPRSGFLVVSSKKTVKVGGLVVKEH